MSDLQNTLECLQNDLDRDVKYFAGGDITEIAALRQLPRQQQPQQQQRMRTDSRDREEQYQDAAEYLDPELIDLEGLYREECVVYVGICVVMLYYLRNVKIHL